MAKSNPYLSVVIPVYNEEDNFKLGVLDPMMEFLNNQKFSWEVLFVDDGSTDKTKNLLETSFKNNSKIRIMSIAHGGKATAVTSGVLSASGEIILFTDFDQSTPITQVTNFIKEHQQGADVVIGIRGGGETTKQDTFIRKLRSWGFLTLVNVIALPDIKDSQCGFKSFKKEVAKKVFSSLKVSLPKEKIVGGYMGAFDVEVLFLAKKHRFSIRQVPVEWIKVSSNKLNIWKEPLMMIRDTLKIRIYDILRLYED